MRIRPASGWWNIAPHSTRHLEFPNSTERNYIYIHGYNSEASWGGDYEDPASWMTVIGEKFKYYYNEANCPEGKNRRTVGFDILYDEGNGVYSWSP